ncbi:MAG: zinc ABC transporter substrate-binding protein [Thermoleophilia bacterium]|nr:zinc ABC transporter substrate-binding protein [Thermoleophilia bacterium]
MADSHKLRSALAALAAVPAALALAGCGQQVVGEIDPSIGERRIRVVATTGMVSDAVEHVGGDRVDVQGLMGPGVDPHLYKASEGDVIRLAEADVVFYNGLHLEAKLADVFERMGGRVRTAAVTDGIPRSRLIASAAFGAAYDPHVWFDVRLWMGGVREVRDTLAELDPASAGAYRRNARAYLAELAQLDRYVRDRVAEVPPGRRVIITAHDAFNYFGRAYGFEVRGLQGISTVSEAGTRDVRELADFVAARRIPALFVESSVSPRTIEAVREAVRARGFDVSIGGSLFSDALGDPDTPAGEYAGMVRHNVDTIVAGLG